MKRSSTTTIAVILMYLQIISYSAAVMDEKDDPQKDIYYWKKKALEYKKEKLQYKKEKLQYKKETLQYRYQKESMEQKKENHKLKAREAMSKQSTDGYAELLRDFANTSESNAGDMSSTSTSANELYPSSSVSSTQSGPEDTTLDDPQKDIYYWKKKALEYKKEKLQYKKEKLQYKKEKLQYRYQKESMEQKKENHKLKAEKAVSNQSAEKGISNIMFRPHDIKFTTTDMNEVKLLPLSQVNAGADDIHTTILDYDESTNFGTGYGVHLCVFKDILRRYRVYLQCATKFDAVVGIEYETARSGTVINKYEVKWIKGLTLHRKVKSHVFEINTCTAMKGPLEIVLMVWATNEKHAKCIHDCQFAVARL
eukprot:983866_1